MIQLNLLPDVKTKFIATERTKHLTIMTAAAICGVAIFIVLALVTVVYGSQKAKLNKLDKEITVSNSELQNIDGLNKILTIQNQLNSLSGLHEQKLVTSRLFDFMPQITPVDVYVGDITVKYEDSSIAINGSAKTLELINKFVDTLKFTKYNTSSNANEQLPAFSSVVLTAFYKADQIKGYTYSITLLFDTNIFSGDYESVTLTVPSIISTRSQTEQPDLLFQEQTEENNQSEDSNTMLEL
jgi:hypothetical protein